MALAEVVDDVVEQQQDGRAGEGRKEVDAVDGRGADR